MSEKNRWLKENVEFFRRAERLKSRQKSIIEGSFVSSGSVLFFKKNSSEKLKDFEGGLRVLQLSRWLSEGAGGGIQTYLASLPEALDRHNVHLRYAALMPGAQPVYLEAPARLGSIDFSKWKNARALRRWLNLEVEHFDVVQIHGATDWHFVFGAMACLRCGVPFLVRPAGGLFPEALSHTRRRWIASRLFLKFIGRHLLSESFAVIASSAHEEKVLKQIDSRIEVRLVPNGVPISKQCPPRIHPKPPPLEVLFLGRISPIKSLSTLLQAISRLQAGGYDARLALVGSGDSKYVDELRRLVDQLDIADCVVWHGYQGGERKVALLRNSHVLVLPSLSENFGFVVAEAMAVGLPVVVSDGVGVADQVREYHAGTVFPKEDSNALAEALLRYFEGSVIKDHGERARHCAMREFSLDTMGERLSKIYREAASSV